MWIHFLCVELDVNGIYVLAVTRYFYSMLTCATRSIYWRCGVLAWCYVDGSILCIIYIYADISCILCVAVESIYAECYRTFNSHRYVVASILYVIERPFHVIACGVSALIQSICCDESVVVNIVGGEIELLLIFCHMVDSLLNDVNVVNAACWGCFTITMQC